MYGEYSVTFVGLFVCMYVCMYACIYIYICMHACLFVCLFEFCSIFWLAVAWQLDSRWALQSKSCSKGAHLELVFICYNFVFGLKVTTSLSEKVYVIWPVNERQWILSVFRSLCKKDRCEQITPWCCGNLSSTLVLRVDWRVSEILYGF
jgi:hypothetical protein